MTIKFKFPGETRKRTIKQIRPGFYDVYISRVIKHKSGDVTIELRKGGQGITIGKNRMMRIW